MGRDRRGAGGSGRGRGSGQASCGVPEKDLIEARRQGIDLEDPPVAPSLQLSDGSVYAHAGEFGYLDPSVDQATDTVLARAVFPNSEGVLLPSQFVTVIVRQKQPVSAVVVPQAAVQKDQQGHFVLVVDRADRAVVRRVVLGEQAGSNFIWECLVPRIRPRMHLVFLVSVGYITPYGDHSWPFLSSSGFW